jgi:hypothetical protein
MCQVTYMGDRRRKLAHRGGGALSGRIVYEYLISYLCQTPGPTALAVAAKRGQLAAMHVLLEAGAHVNASNQVIGSNQFFFFSMTISVVLFHVACAVRVSWVLASRILLIPEWWLSCRPQITLSSQTR